MWSGASPAVPSTSSCPSCPISRMLVALAREAAGLVVHLGHQRAGRVDRLEAALGGLGVHHRRDAVGGEDDRRALGHLVELLDEDRATVGEVVDDVLVVDDLLADVDRGAVEVERLLDRDDGAVDAGAVAARVGQQHAASDAGACRERLRSGHAPILGDARSGQTVAGGGARCRRQPKAVGRRRRALGWRMALDTTRGHPRTAATDLAADRRLHRPARRRLGRGRDRPADPAAGRLLPDPARPAAPRSRSTPRATSACSTPRRPRSPRARASSSTPSRRSTPPAAASSLELREIRPQGEGELLAQLERRKQLLAAEGLFDPRLKKPLPLLPRGIGLITGKASAAERDVLRERAPALARRATSSSATP